MKTMSIFDLKVILDYNLKEEKNCIELHFYVEQNKYYNSCWLGKFISKENKEVYWLGLTEDGKEAYDFGSKEEMINAKVFCGKSLQDIWEMITIISIDNCVPKERLLYYKKK